MSSSRITNANEAELTLEGSGTMALPRASREQGTFRINGVDGVDGSASEVRRFIDRKTNVSQSIETSIPGPIITDGVCEPDARAGSREDDESASEVAGGAGIVDAIGCEDAQVGLAKERRVGKVSPVESHDSSQTSGVVREIVQDVGVVVCEPDLGGFGKGGDSEAREADASPKLDDGFAAPHFAIGDDVRGQELRRRPWSQTNFVAAVVDQ